jgi:hypothetical protein
VSPSFFSLLAAAGGKNGELESHAFPIDQTGYLFFTLEGYRKYGTEKRFVR